MWWAKEDHDVRDAVIMLLSQVYPILIATISSIGSKNLSVYDAHHALVVSASPVTAYLAWSAFLGLIGQESALFKRIKGDRVIIRPLALFIPFLWLFISLTTTFSQTAFRGSELCATMTLPRWVEFELMYNILGMLDVMGMRGLWADLEERGGMGIASLAILWLWGLHVIRHTDEIWATVRVRRQHQLHLVRWIFLPWDLPIAVWYVLLVSARCIQPVNNCN